MAIQISIFSKALTPDENDNDNRPMLLTYTELERKFNIPHLRG
ncbi:3971_t:CDS:1, partial [Racocetra fulgida]